MSVYTIKGLKTFRGMDTDGYNVTLCRDGKPVAFVTNDGSGGEVDIRWNDADKPRSVEVAWKVWKHGEGDERGGYVPGTIHCTPEEALLYEECRGKTVEFGGELGSLEMDPELFVGALIDKAEEAKMWKRKCAKATCFVLKMQAEGQYMVCKAPFTPAEAARIRAKYGDQLKEIINERFL